MIEHLLQLLLELHMDFQEHQDQEQQHEFVLKIDIHNDH